MLDFIKRSFTKTSTPDPDKTLNIEPPKSIFSRLKEGLTKTRSTLSEGIAQVFLGKKEIDAVLLKELETSLLSNDIGVTTTKHIIQQLTFSVSRKQLKNVSDLKDALKVTLLEILKPVSLPLQLESLNKPYVILMVGVNGTGKTTTIGKLAKQFKEKGHTVLLAAGDTFRAAAVEQLKVWGERNEVPVIAQTGNADSASVIFDAIQSAQARGIDIVIADTAGRLHTQHNLMEELKKIVKVIRKCDATAPHEIMLVLDAGIGQNALVQAEKFHEAIQLSGLTITKLDGSAKGGIIFAIANSLQIPIRYIGIGEGLDDLKPFDAENFVEALFADIV
ncbi:MAG: signal recognition particle-docking protein FtsY [Francisellaceae bacterium]|nr:signal recognition particle-docking protein FtsY [Francisellaceae bacterium]